MTTSQLGNIGEARVLSEFVKLGVPCYIPYGDGNTADLIAQFNNKLNRIQIKTTTSLNKAGAMEWKVTRQEGYHGNRVQYNVNDIDYFAFYCLETDIVCLVPFDENGVDIEYTITEANVDNYSTTITGSEADGFTITNTYAPNTTSVTVSI